MSMPPISEAFDILVGDMAREFTPKPFLRPAKPRRQDHEILHDIETLASDTYWALMNMRTGDFRDLDKAVRVFTAESLQRLVTELAGVQHG